MWEIHFYRFQSIMKLQSQIIQGSAQHGKVGPGVRASTHWASHFFWVFFTTPVISLSSKQSAQGTLNQNGRRLTLTHRQLYPSGVPEINFRPLLHTTTALDTGGDNNVPGIPQTSMQPMT
jgi:hypothetical protein